jgi:hypothetical protein
LNSEIMLKNLFLRQQQRMEAMTEFEDKTKTRSPDGYKRVSTLRGIAAEVRKLEVGEQWMRGKCGNMPSVHPLEDDPEELSPLARELLEFDEVDRSIVRELTVRLVEMAQEEARRRFKSVGLEGNAEPERGAAEAADERAIRPPLAKEMLKFDEVDPSIMRELIVRMVEMAEKARGSFKGVGLEGDAGPERADMTCG